MTKKNYNNLIYTTEHDNFTQFLHQLNLKAIQHYYNPYQKFTWTDYLPDNAYWMTPALMTVYGTPLIDELDECTLYRLSKWESIYFYSLNIHGIKELLSEVIHRIHVTGFETIADFFHHFIGEENAHMWFFAEFCRRYGHKIYPPLSVFSGKLINSTNTITENNDHIQHFLVFARILIFEEIADYYNTTMAKDTHLHETIRQINHVHHQDEARHIAFGRKLVILLYKKLSSELTKEKLQALEQYLKRYITYNLRSFYNPYVYQDAGITNPFDFRARLMQFASRRQIEHQFVQRSIQFFTKSGIFSDAVLPE